jgi:hypothetical protein
MERPETALTETLDRESLREQLARLDTDWRYERLKHMLSDRYHQPYVPRRAMSVFFSILGLALSAVSLPLFVFAVVGGDAKLVHWMFAGMSLYMIAFGQYSRCKAIDYEQAFGEYLRKRAELLERA